MRGRKKERGEGEGRKILFSIPAPSLLPLTILDYFQEPTKFSEDDNNDDLILWNNRKITIERNGVFWKQWFDYGVAFISDLMNSDGKFLTLIEFQSKFEIKVN